MSNERAHGGCVTNFDHGDKRLTIWKLSGGRFELSEFGIGGAILPLTYEPLFQSIAEELHRLACEVGRLRRVELEARRALAPFAKWADAPLGPNHPADLEGDSTTPALEWFGECPLTLGELRRAVEAHRLTGGAARPPVPQDEWPEVVK